MRQAYENSFGIHDYLDQSIKENVSTNIDIKRPLSEVALHAAEDISSTSKLFEMIRIYKDRKVYSTFGLNLIEFLELTPEICDHILTLCMEQQISDVTAQNKVLQDLNNPSQK